MARGQTFDNASPCPTKDQVVYVLDGIPYLPHYQHDGLFVGPGYGVQNAKVYSAAQLMRAGARQSHHELWVR